jgi:hypothetical protein
MTNLTLTSFCKGQRGRTIGFVLSRTPARYECWVRFGKKHTWGLPKWLRFVEQRLSGVASFYRTQNPAPS